MMSGKKNPAEGTLGVDIRAYEGPPHFKELTKGLKSLTNRIGCVCVDGAETGSCHTQTI